MLEDRSHPPSADRQGPGAKHQKRSKFTHFPASRSGASVSRWRCLPPAAGVSAPQPHHGEWRTPTGEEHMDTQQQPPVEAAPTPAPAPPAETPAAAPAPEAMSAALQSQGSAISM